MPRDALKNVRDSLQPSMPPSTGDGTDNGIANMAIMHAIKGVADVLERVVARQDDQDRSLRDIATTNHNIDKRLSLIENGKVELEVKDLQKRVTDLETHHHHDEASLKEIPDMFKRLAELEKQHHRQIGMLDLTNWISKNWQFIAVVAYVLFHTQINAFLGH